MNITEALADSPSENAHLLHAGRLESALGWAAVRLEASPCEDPYSSQGCRSSGFSTEHAPPPYHTRFAELISYPRLQGALVKLSASHFYSQLLIMFLVKLRDQKVPQRKKQHQTAGPILCPLLLRSSLLFFPSQSHETAKS